MNFNAVKLPAVGDGAFLIDILPKLAAVSCKVAYEHGNRFRGGPPAKYSRAFVGFLWLMLIVEIFVISSVIGCDRWRRIGFLRLP